MTPPGGKAAGAAAVAGAVSGVSVLYFGPVLTAEGEADEGSSPTIVSPASAALLGAITTVPGKAGAAGAPGVAAGAGGAGVCAKTTRGAI